MHKTAFRLINFSLFIILFLLGANAINACSCGETPNLLEAYEGADQVVVLRAVSVEKATAQSENEYFVDGVKSTKMIVEKVYKGTLKVGNEIKFAQGGGADCIWTFSEKSVGESYLFYLSAPKKSGNPWYGFGCGRSSSVKGAIKDLNFLNNFNDLRGKTRVSGNIECWGTNCPNISKRKIKLIGENNKNYQTVTDQDGFYEIYDLPAGKYIIEPEIPFGYKVSNYWLRYSTSFIGGEEFESREPQKQFPILLKDKKHAELDFHFEIDNAIRGRVISPSGEPMKGICVYAVSPDAKEFKFGPFNCTNKEGKFVITELNLKNYVLVINGDREIEATQPTKMLFYPGVSERSQATVLEISEGKEVTLKDFRIPQLLETVTLSGKLYYADGKPVQTQRVQFYANTKDPLYESDPYKYTEDDGSFEIKIFKGQNGRLRSEMIFGTRDLGLCPDLKKAVVENRENLSIITASSQWIDIKADKDLSDLKITLPFKECKRD